MTAIPLVLTLGLYPVVCAAAEPSAGESAGKSAAGKSDAEAGGQEAPAEQVVVAGANGGATTASDDLVLYAEQWDTQRSGERIIALPVLKKLMQAWLTHQDHVIEIQYPGGEEGEFWVQELSDWLVALGVPATHLVITPGSGGADMIRFVLRHG